MKITGSNITDIIIYLYDKRLGQTPNSEVIQSWSNLSDDEAQMHLEQLFKSWGYDMDEMKSELNNYQISSLAVDSNDLYDQDYTVTDRSKEQFGHHSTEVEKQFHSSEPSQTSLPQSTSSKSKKGIWLLLLPILAIGAYMAYQYNKFKSLTYLYVTTDNVSIRNHAGENIGRMDIFASKSSVSFLRTTDYKSYPIKVGENYYDCRRVVFDTTKFLDYFLGKPEAFGYVNENYVIDNKDDFILFRNVFKEINEAKNENAALTAPYRKTIVGSIRQNSTFKELYLKNTCNNKSKEYSALIKLKTKDNYYQVVAQLSDGKYYVFTGHPETQTFEAPQPFLIKQIGQDEMLQLQGEQILFKYTNKAYFLFDCPGLAKEFYVQLNSDGLISHAKYSFEP